MTTSEAPITVERVSVLAGAILDEVEVAVVGKRPALELVLSTVLAGGHVLLEDFPGLGKTLAARSFAQTLGLTFTRVQFTPDMLPGDLTGSFIYDQRSSDFAFRKGPLFTGLLLADEINRTPPKTQAALLEAMQERRVTVAGRTYALPAPFFVLATQNPIEQEGTYPLPEAQLDRFMFNLQVGYPSHAEEVRILLETTTDTPVTLEKVWTATELLALQHAVRQVPVPASVAQYAVSLVQATRPSQSTAPDFVKRYVQWGAGPRASQYLALAGKAFAVLDGRFNVAREDIQRAAKLVLRHRLLTNYRAEADGQTVDALIDKLLQTVR